MRHQLDWLTRLFSASTRLRVLEARELSVRGRVGGVVTVAFSYLELQGHDAVGKARLYLPPEVRDSPVRRLPLVHNAGYELDEKGALGLLAKGYAVSTPHAHPLNPLGRGVNLDRAILQYLRPLSCLDPRRLSIQGGSAGGWMTLMLAADAFPLTWVMPDVPPIHWGYNADYIGRHQAMGGPPPGSDKPRMPFVLAVGGIAAQAKSTYGMPFESATFLALSPLAHLETITAPTQVTFSTADILVPIDQVGADLVHPINKSLFPKGFSTALSPRFPGVKGKRTLLSALGRGALFVVAPPPAGKSLVLPFSRTKAFSIVVVDEGAVEPGNGHTKNAWGMDHEPFRLWAEERGVLPEQLTAPKLERLMQRYLGQPWRPYLIRLKDASEEQPATVLNYPDVERADVLLSLQAFAQDEACAALLGKRYRALPLSLKALGPQLGDSTAAGVRSALAALTP